jgi:hypothetical protein
MTDGEARKIVYEKETRPIVRGDRVIIRFASGQALEGDVHYIPTATGESWHIFSTECRMHYVQTFEFMYRQPKREWYEAQHVLDESTR